MSRVLARPLVSCPEAYDRSFNSFKEAVKEGVRLEKCIENHVIPMIRSRVCDDVKRHSSSPFRVLGVGSGQGENDLTFLYFMSELLVENEQPKKLFNRAIEPNETALLQFRSKTETLSDGGSHPWERVEFEWMPTTFQQYVEQKREADVKFDVVHFMHSIYYVGEAELKHCYENELDEKGIIISISNTQDNSMARYRTRCAELGIALDDRIFANSEDVVAVARENGWKYLECPSDTEIVDITTIFDVTSEEGNYLLDFLLNWIDFRLTADHGMVEEILKFWNEESSVDDYGKRIVELKNRAVIIFKG